MRRIQAKSGQTHELYGIVLASCVEIEREMDGLIWGECIRSVYRSHNLDAALRSILAGEGHRSAICVIVKDDAPLVPIGLVTLTQSWSEKGVATGCHTDRTYMSGSRLKAMTVILGVSVLDEPLRTSMFRRVDADLVERYRHHARISRPIQFSFGRAGQGRDIVPCWNHEWRAAGDAGNAPETWILAKFDRPTSFRRPNENSNCLGPFSMSGHLFFCDLAGLMIENGIRELNRVISAA